MKELRRKTFLTIFFILSAILIVSLVFLNIQNYSSRRESIERSLNIIDERRGGKGFRDDQPPGQMQNPEDTPEGQMHNPEAAPQNPEESKQEQNDIKNMMIMDQEVYSVELQNGEILRVIEHGDFDSDFDAESVAKEIIKDNSESTDKIGNLFFADYSFKYKKDVSIAISNNKSVKKELVKLLIWSLIIFLVMEVIIYLICTIVTKWITKPAEEAFQKQKDFIADASHELKTPLAVIMASADELEVNEGALSKNKQADDSEEKSVVASTEDLSRKYIRNIKYETDRMNKLIAGMLNLSKLENGLDKSVYKEENLSKIVEKTCLVFEGVAFENSLSIETDIQEGINYKCSKEEIEKMISTILDNAIKHSDRDTAIKVKMNRAKGGINICVTNTGSPIPEGENEKIFERFYRSDKSRSRSENRYGLGLAIAKSIAINHDGNIRAYSKDGETTFEIMLGA